MLAVLSTGPVGFSDAPGETDATLIMRTCDASGGLLQPSKPLTAVDSTHDVTHGAAPSGFALVTHTAVGGAVALYMLVSHQMTASFTVRGLDLWPALSPVSGAFMTTSWAALQSCAAGSACNTSAIAAPAQGSAPLFTLPALAPGVDKFTPTLTLVAPVCTASRVALFGETAKFASISIQRFTALACTPAGIAMSLTGPPGEALRLAWWTGSAMAFGDALLPASGSGSAQLACEARADGTLVCA